MDFDRIPGVTADGDLPDIVRERMAEHFADQATPEGQALSRTIGEVVGEEISGLGLNPSTPASSGFLRIAGTTPGSVPVVKPLGDGRAGVWEMTHNDTAGYLFHLLAGANMGHSQALMGLGVDNDGIGVLIPNKSKGRAIVIDQRATVNAADAYGIHATQRSTAAPLVRLEQQGSGVAPVLQLLSFSGMSGRLLHIVNGDGEVGSVHGANGRLDWFRDVVIRNQSTGEVPSFLTLSTSAAANAANTRKVFHAPDATFMFGNAGAGTGSYYPYKFAWSASSFAIQTAPTITNKGTEPSPGDVGTAVTRLSFSHSAGTSIEAGTVRALAGALGFHGAAATAQGAAIADPTGGTVVDIEARAALAALLAVIRTKGLIAT